MYNYISQNMAAPCTRNVGEPKRRSKSFETKYDEPLVNVNKSVFFNRVREQGFLNICVLL